MRKDIHSIKPIMDNRNTLFPIFLKLHQLNTLVVGGGYVGLEKLQALLKNEPAAKVTVVSIEFLPELVSLAEKHDNITLIERAFEEVDLNGVDIAILATNIREVNHQIRDLSRAKGILTNVADTPDLCDFYLGSTVTKGQLKVGISTNGKSPTFAKRFRELLEEALPEEIDELLASLSQFRNTLKGDFEAKVKALNEHTASLVSDKKTKD